jgi:tRNA dimethylallyltransferase
VKEKQKIIVIVGPTASGKTSLSIDLAKKFNGEVVSADSRQVYSGLDIGTGKVTKEETQGIPHHLLDVADPQNTYTVADYVRDGRAAIASIHSRGKLPIIVGGTFLYIDALIGKISMPEVPPNNELRTHLATFTNDALFQMLERQDPLRALTIDRDNKRRLVRALEITNTIGVVPNVERNEIYDVLTLGIEISREKLVGNIHERLITRLNGGMIEEAQNLYNSGLSYMRLEELGIEYQYIALFLQDKITKEGMLTQIETKSRQYAKRQMTWLKRDKKIQWVRLNELELVTARVSTFLEE